MRVGVYSDSLPKLGRRDLLKWCAERGVSDIEIGVGAWGPWPRPHLDFATVGRPVERDRLAGELREFGIRLAAVNAAGNLLHPDPAKRKDAQVRFDAAVDLAVALGVKRVITMSGCPAGPGGGSLGVFPCWATSADDERIFDWQMQNEVGPFWKATSERLAGVDPELIVCLELHPGVTVFTAASFEALLPYIGRNIGLNMDPSHFWWQGIDPLAAVRYLGPQGAIFHVHAKDTFINEAVCATTSLLENGPMADVPARAWSYITLGYGHDERWWRSYCYRLRMNGYDGWLSIEHEDVVLSRVEGVRRSVELLKLVAPVEASDYAP